MGRKNNFTKETKLLAVQQYQSGIKNILEIASELGCHFKSVVAWIRNYESIGEKVFDEKPRNRSYTKELKTEIIVAYLNGEGSYTDLAKKYQISSHTLILNWVSKYNRHNEVKSYDPKGYVYMAKTRKVSFEEKLEIIKWTIEHEYQYKLAAEKFETSYAQIFNWVKKYKADGEQGLRDNRGKRKSVEHLKALHIVKIKMEVNWQFIEKEIGQYSWDALDYRINTFI